MNYYKTWWIFSWSYCKLYCLRKRKSNRYKRSSSITDIEENGFSITNIEEKWIRPYVCNLWMDCYKTWLIFPWSYCKLHYLRKRKSNRYKRSNSITDIEENGFSITNIEENGFNRMYVTYGWIVTKLGEYFLDYTVNYIT